MISMSAMKSRIILRVAALLPVVALVLSRTMSGPPHI
jgi:hypothetical protein